MRKIIFVLATITLLLNYSCSKISNMNVPGIGPSLQEKFSKKMPELQEMSELGCVEYTVTKVIASDDERKWYGSLKIIYNCVAYLKAGIDMKKIDASKIVIDENNKSIVLTLPQPTLQVFNMPTQKIKVAYEKKTGLRSKFSNEERLKIKQLGEESIRKDVVNMGIYDDAKKHADTFFRALLREMGFEIITIKFE